MARNTDRIPRPTIPKLRGGSICHHASIQLVTALGVGDIPSRVLYTCTITTWLASPKSVHILVLGSTRRLTSRGSSWEISRTSGNVEYTVDVRDGREAATKVSSGFTGDGTACGSCVNARGSCEENCEDRRDHFEVEVDERSRRENNQKLVEVEQMEDREL
jgi:hypothetical protein